LYYFNFAGRFDLSQGRETGILLMYGQRRGKP